MTDHVVKESKIRDDQHSHRPCREDFAEAVNAIRISKGYKNDIDTLRRNGHSKHPTHDVVIFGPGGSPTESGANGPQLEKALDISSASWAQLAKAQYLNDPDKKDKVNSILVKATCRENIVALFVSNEVYEEAFESNFTGFARRCTGVILLCLYPRNTPSYCRTKVKTKQN
jgi:hypothetical protein